MSRPRPHGEERGLAAAVEFTLLVPALVLMLGLMIAGGRVWFARTTVVEAAQTGARAASLARTPSAADRDGREAARQSLSTGGLDCASTSVRIDTSGFGIAVGTPASVAAEVACVVSFDDILLPGTPGTIRLSGQRSSALDTYRSR